MPWSFCSRLVGLTSIICPFSFLTKHLQAQFVGALGKNPNTLVQRSINTTIDRFQRSSVGPHGPGTRYARLLYLLSRKSQMPTRPPSRGSPVQTPQQGRASRTLVSDQLMSRGPAERQPDVDPLHGFSWRDLNAVGTYITNDTANILQNSGDPRENIGLDLFGNNWYDQLELGNDIVF